MKEAIFLSVLFISCIAFKEDGASSSSYRDYPKPPEILNIRCNQTEAVFSWAPSKGVKDTPILNYLIEYSNTFNPNMWEVKDRVSAKSRIYKAELSPWSNSTFRVKAVSKVGASIPASHFVRCTAAADVPYRNPTDVVLTPGPGSLVISWTPMPLIEHHGPGFRYMVFWKKDASGELYEHHEDLAWNQGVLIVMDLPSATRYRVKVVAANDLGEANIEAKEVIGYSGK